MSGNMLTFHIIFTLVKALFFLPLILLHDQASLNLMYSKLALGKGEEKNHVQSPKKSLLFSE